MYSVFLVTDREKHRRQWTHVIGSTAACRLAGDAYSFKEALAKIPRHRPDVVLVDLAIGDGQGQSLIREVSNQSLSVALVAVATAPGEESAKARQALAAGATGFLRGADVDRELERALLCAGRGEIFVSEAAKQHILR